MVVGLARGVPEPAFHDEFSYLLAADTFASGRLTNPPHPLWEHFETFHVIHQPTYASKYPPAQGLVLALGQVVAHRPILGVWLTAGLLAAATTWMLLVWLPPAWAILAALVCLVQVSWTSYWSHSYWGGHVAAIGSAIAFGAVQSLWKRPHLAHGALLGLGLGIMALSRPFEGAVVGAGVASAVVLQMVRDRRDPKKLPASPLLVTACVLGVMLTWLALYNWRVTGSALVMPYQVHERIYASAPSLLFQPAGIAPKYRHRELESYWMEWGARRHQRHRETGVWPVLIAVKVWAILFFFLGPAVYALLGVFGRISERGILLPCTTMLAGLAATVATKASLPHYAAAIAPLLYLLLGAGLWNLHRSPRRQAINGAVLIVFALCLYLPYSVARTWREGPTLPFRSGRSATQTFGPQRQELLKKLELAPTRSLVIVRYGPRHNYHEEWVQNRADIDNAKVVWARSMGDEKDGELLRYFHGRTTWLLTVDDRPILEPYAQ